MRRAIKLGASKEEKVPETSTEVQPKTSVAQGKYRQDKIYGHQITV